MIAVFLCGVAAGLLLALLIDWLHLKFDEPTDAERIASVLRRIERESHNRPGRVA